MILQGSEAIEAVSHLLISAKLRAAGAASYVFYHGGQRYGPFFTRDHARLMQRQLGWCEEILMLPPTAFAPAAAEVS